MTFGVLTVVLVSEVGNLVGYGTVLLLLLLLFI